MLYELSLSTNYVSNWGFLEAVRELLQNAIDQGEFTLNINKNNTLKISSYGVLPVESILFGYTTKQIEYLSTNTYNQLNDSKIINNEENPEEK